MICKESKGGVPAALGQRQVNDAPAGVRRVVHVTGAERIDAFLLGGKESRARLVPKDGLGAIAVMGIEVHDQDSTDAIIQGMAGGDGNIVEQAKAHRRVRLGMVPRRADDGKGIARLTREHCARAGQGCPGSQERVRVGGRGNIGGGVVGDAGAEAAGGFEAVQHIVGVDAGHGLTRGRLRVQETQGSRVRFRGPVTEILEAGGRFLVVWENMFRRKDE